MTDGRPGGPHEVDRSDQHKHLDFVQAVINRLANNSFLMKGWTLTLSSALLGFAVTQKHAGLALVAVVPAAAFWVLDTYYLRLERAFRDMYADIAARRVTDFKIEPKPYVEKQPWSASWSISLLVFYLTVFTLAVAVALVLAVAASTTQQSPPQESGSQGTSVERSAPDTSPVQSSPPAYATTPSPDTSGLPGSPESPIMSPTIAETSPGGPASTQR